MTEQQIIDRINATTDTRELTNQLRQVRQMEDYLHELQEGQKQASLEWVNSSPLVFPEDFAAEMNQLHAELGASKELLDQLSRIERALEQRLEQLGKK